MADFDVFLSYAHEDKARVDRLEQALLQAGVRLWRDNRLIRDFEDITERLKNGLGRSKTLVALYSRHYPRKLWCQWELTTALIAQGDGPIRVLLLNPEADDRHLAPRRPITLHPRWPESDAAWAELAQTIRDRVSSLDGALPLRRTDPAMRWVGLSPNAGNPDFHGRFAELWTLHDALLSDRRRAVIAGHAGIGKTSLAREYADRFAACYPGGVFLLAPGRQGSASALAAVATALGKTATPDALAAALARDGRPYLWLVDDFPAEATDEDARAWLAPTLNGHTLITTRWRSRDVTVELEGLDRDSAHDLLGGREGLSTECAGPILSQMGGHPGALTWVREQLNYYRSPLALAEALSVSPPDLPDLAGSLAWLGADPPCRDAVWLAARLSPLMVPLDLLESATGETDAVRQAIRRLADQCLCRVERAAYVVPLLVIRLAAPPPDAFPLSDRALERLVTALNAARKAGDGDTVETIRLYITLLVAPVTTATRARALDVVIDNLVENDRLQDAAVLRRVQRRFLENVQ